MRPFTIYHLCNQSFSFHQEKLVAIIQETVKADMIYLLGGSFYRRRSESIFNTTAPTSHHTSDYFLLILIQDPADKGLYEWQDIIEQRCAAVMPVTAMVLPTATFEQWLQDSHTFALRVCQSAIPLYDAGSLPLTSVEAVEIVPEKDLKKQYIRGLGKAKEFLAGSELFRVRQQNAMAAFMLHQSAEQALGTLLKVGTGFHCYTHNLNRLIRYASLVSYKLPDIFPQKRDQDKRLFNLLQRAYVESRYREHYRISTDELLCLTGKVRCVLEVLVDVGEGVFG